MVCLVFALGTRKGCIENRGSPTHRRDSDSTRAGGNVSDDSDGDDDDGGDADDDEATDSSGVNI